MLTTDSLLTDNGIRRQLRNFYRKDETQVLEYLLPIANISNAARSQAWERARELVVNIRKQQVGKGGVDALLNEFALSTEEGVVLMCLAEALLRVPDNLTMDRLIRDKLLSGNWSSHLGNSDSLFVNASAWGLLLTGKVVTYNDDKHRQQFGLLKKTLGRVGEPVIRASVRYAMEIMGAQFVMGTSIDKAVERARAAEEQGYRYSYDMLGEGARTMADANRYFDSYMTAIECIGKAAAGRGPIDSPGISVKLSAIHPRYEYSHWDRVKSELIPRLKQLALEAKKYDIGFTVDAEEADRLDMSLDIIEAVFSDPDLEDWEGFGIAVQAYQRRGLLVIEWARDLTIQVGRKLMLRLVKGAYWDSEIKLAQVEGHPDFPVFTQKAATDVSYQACARKLLQYRDTIYPQFATHNAYTVATILEMDDSRSGYEFQRLHGMGDALYNQVLNQEKVPCRIYAPVGLHADLLAYLVRRLLENGANSSFVNNIVDENIPVESLLEDPVEQASRWSQKSNPHIALPADLFGAQRTNSSGMDLTDPNVLVQSRTQMNAWLAALPLDYRKQAANQTESDSLEVVNPADHSELVGLVSLSDTPAMENALARCHQAFASWSQTAVAQRAAILDSLADALESNRDQLIALCCKEAGKTIADGVAEVREAVDFCRYYAARAVSEDFAEQGLSARGVVLCISPWNFPLAIFLGQVSAALAVGNTVIAKPAEQTSLIACRVVELLRLSGLPDGVVELVIAAGPTVGQHIVPDPRIKTVMFTGSTATGRTIARTLAQRGDAPIPLIAETGGQNCMLVDSTALPEQVVDDVINSGFQSAGQRCSALRVLFLQDEIADKVITMIGGAMAELQLGDPAKLSTDIGPVIDRTALERLESHVSRMDEAGRLLHACEAPAPSAHSFFAPRLYEISNLSLLDQEVFGPIVHVIRYKANELDAVIQQINDTGFGLTFGIHSRIEQLANDVAAQVEAGNIYVNRNMIGAVVGVQPFGGRGLSGTGPKAGGPQYLSRLVSTGETAEPSAQQRALADNSKTDVSDQLKCSAEVQSQWAATNLNDRLSVLRQFIAHYATTNSAHTIAADISDDVLEHTLAQAREQLLYAATVLQAPQELPGPTGESNILYLEARGHLATIADQPSCNGEYLLALLSALAAGNTVTVLADANLLDKWQMIATTLQHSGLPAPACNVLPLEAGQQTLASPHIAGALVHVKSVHLQASARILAQREGAIVPLISCVSNQNLLRQTLLEKTVSIDTTAAGGNTSLMTMAV